MGTAPAPSGERRDGPPLPEGLELQAETFFPKLKTVHLEIPVQAMLLLLYRLDSPRPGGGDAPDVHQPRLGCTRVHPLSRASRSFRKSGCSSHGTHWTRPCPSLSPRRGRTTTAQPGRPRRTCGSRSSPRSPSRLASPLPLLPGRDLGAAERALGATRPRPAGVAARAVGARAGGERLGWRALVAELQTQGWLALAPPGVAVAWCLGKEEKDRFCTQGAEALAEPRNQAASRRMFGIVKMIHLQRFMVLANVFRGQEVLPNSVIRGMEGEGDVGEKIDRLQELAAETVQLLIWNRRTPALAELEKAYDVVAAALTPPQGEKYDLPFHWCALGGVLRCEGMRELPLQLDASLDFVFQPLDLRLLGQCWKGLESFLLNVNERRGHGEKLPERVVREQERIREASLQGRRDAEDYAMRTVEAEHDKGEKQRRYGEVVDPPRGPIEIGHPRVVASRLWEMNHWLARQAHNEPDAAYAARREAYRAEYKRHSTLERWDINYWNLPPLEPGFRVLEQADSDVPDINLSDLVAFSQQCRDLKHVRVDFNARNQLTDLSDLPEEPSSLALEKIDLTAHCRFDKPRYELVRWCRAHWPNARINMGGMQQEIMAPGRALKLSEFEMLKKGVPTLRQVLEEQSRGAVIVAPPAEEDTLPTERTVPAGDVNIDDRTPTFDVVDEHSMPIPSPATEGNGKKRARTPDSDDESAEHVPASRVKRLATGASRSQWRCLPPSSGPAQLGRARGGNEQAQAG
ncbi:hypothetical protein CALCODRAFT_500619 [Calocera cornea HHB12733]|uniref:Uncharacterized protein n=1 Tax=Calocera cornea HHB12733 TaxID=1353952 RepID=A0A165E0H4_9BASI|nr:hypothetical protein CALCODRAFT_500619 [Calocera cornea HHB12733]